MFLLQVGLIAANDGIILRNHIPRILKRHFKDESYYVDLLDLFNEVVLFYNFSVLKPLWYGMVWYGMV